MLQFAIGIASLFGLDGDLAKDCSPEKAWMRGWYRLFVSDGVFFGFHSQVVIKACGFLFFN